MSEYLFNIPVAAYIGNNQVFFPFQSNKIYNVCIIMFPSKVYVRSYVFMIFYSMGFIEFKDFHS